MIKPLLLSALVLYSIPFHERVITQNPLAEIIKLTFPMVRGYEENENTEKKYYIIERLPQPSLLIKLEK